MVHSVHKSRLLRAVLSALLAVCTAAVAGSVQATNESGAILQFQRSAVEAQRELPSLVFQADNAVQPTGLEVAQPTENLPPADRRQLAPRSPGDQPPRLIGPSTAEHRANPFALPQIESLTTAGAGLAIVVGLFLLCMTLLRRSGPKPTSPLPREAVAVLGRVPLAARNFAHLLQVGNKLVLVAITPDGVSPITEVTEPAEVQRLLGLCLGGSRQSTTAEFQQVMQQLAEEPAKGFLGGEATAAYSRARR